jgi:hypothetical protein
MDWVRLLARGNRVLAIAAVGALVPVLCLASKEFVMPTPQAAKTYPAHNEDASHAITIGLDPYDNDAKAKIFSIHYNELDLLPIFVVVTNDGNEPVQLSGMNAQLLTANHSKLDPASTDEIRRRVTRPVSRRSYPLPFPNKTIKGGLSQKQLEEIERAQFGARAVEPHSTRAGFLFFDVSGISDPLAGARFYLNGVHDSKGEEIMYFEIPLDRSPVSQ